METSIITPRMSEMDTDNLIEKFRFQLTNKCENDINNGRKLTITPVSMECTDTEIDKQLTDLENMIKLLQDELYQMCENADKEVKEYFPFDEKDCKTIFPVTKVNKDKDVNVKTETKKQDDQTEVEKNHEMYPLIIRDMMLPLTNGCKSFGKAVVDVIKSKSESSVEASKKVDLVKDDLVDSWDSLSEYAPTDGLEELVSELQAQISAKLETLKDVDI